MKKKVMMFLVILMGFAGISMGAAPVTFVYNDESDTLTQVNLKGSWNKTTGVFDAAWDGGATQQMYDDGTNGDAVAGDNRFSLTVELNVDTDTTIWAYQMQDGSGNSLISGENPEFLVPDESEQLLVYPRESVTITFIIDDTKDDYYITACKMKGIFILANGEPNDWAYHTMFDDGSHGDETAGDHIWTIQIDLLPDTDMDSIYQCKWGAEDQDGTWLTPGGYKFLVLNNNEQTLIYELPEVSAEIVTAMVYFQVNMSVMEDLGIFSIDDIVQVAGTFNSWGRYPETANMSKIPGTLNYELLVPVTSEIGSEENYKFRIKFNADHLAALREINPYIGEELWEVLALTGGMNRAFTFEGDTLGIQEVVKSFNDLPQEAIIPEGHSIQLTFNMDMRHVTEFDPAVDTLFLVIQDKTMLHLSGYQTSKPDAVPHPDLIYSDADGDSIYTLMCTITGKIPYVFVYFGRTIGEHSLREGGGIFTKMRGKFRCRYIQPLTTDPVTWPTEYVFPTDVFTPDSSLDVEEPPLSIPSIVFSDNIVPTEFKLEQNYPNPFNPVTQIRFSISRSDAVKMIVYNMLGQTVNYVSYDNLQPGNYTFVWNGNDINGNSVASGIYFYELRVGDRFRDTKKMVLLK